MHSVIVHNPDFRSMAPRTSTGKTWRSQQLSDLLSSTILEWVLMLLLLLEGLLSYLVTTFARLCKLHPPCLLCTRIDHVLGKAQPGFYRDLMCNSHKAEASSWAFCQIHQKLVDANSMCDTCLLSLGADKNSSIATYQSLAGKLDVGVGNAGLWHNFSLNIATEAPVIKEGTSCSCCLSPLKVGSYRSVDLQNKASAIDSEEIGGYVSRDQFIDEINYVAYSELKTSDSESEPRQHGNIASISKTDGSASIHFTELPCIGAQHPTEHSDTRDQSEDDVWHNALSSIKESSVADKPAETCTAANEPKSEFTDQPARKDSSRVHEDLKLLLSQISSNDTISIPSAHEQLELAILQNINRSLSLERNHSDVSESTVNESKAECATIDELKQQIELDRKSMMLLWKELEEERNASAVAASQTMAMITRLQEEKAAMQMEASQHKRMMQEQNDYDREELHRMASMVLELEAEIVSYKARLKDKLIVTEIRDAMCLDQECEPSMPRRAQLLSGFDDEKVYISRHLVKLRQKLHHFSNNSKFKFIDASSELDNDEEEDDEVDDSDHHSTTDEDVHMQDADEHAIRGGNNFKYLSIGRDDYAVVSENDIVSFEDDISELGGRLRALEADHSFLEHSMNSLKNGKDGEELIHGIACSLRDLRNMGISTT